MATVTLLLNLALTALVTLQVTWRMLSTETLSKNILPINVGIYLMLRKVMLL